ncbi:MAG: patatin-like phospholipase family protein [Gemmatimonadetes bacterium]|nr:patatin-like phospholipase family protein [Gemmatimonadota bacterium]
MTARAVTAVLSGGGVKTAAHLGALEVLAQAGHVPTRFVGTSMGAVISAGLAAGLSIADVRVRLLAIERSQVAALDRTALVRGVFAPAMFRGPRLRETLGKLLPVGRFADLQLPLTVTAADLDTGALVLFGDGGVDAPLADALYASCALPVFYPAAQWEGRRLGDGGLRAVLPLEVAASFPADLVLAIDVGPGFDAAPSRDRPPPALLRAHNDAQHLLMATQTKQALELWRLTPGRPPLVYVRPAVHRGETFAFAAVDGYMAAGRRAAAVALGRSP